MADKQIHIAFNIEGDLAEAFTDERRKNLASKSELARTALVFYLKAQGYEVEDKTRPWGGYRERSEDESQEEEQLAVARG